MLLLENFSNWRNLLKRGECVWWNDDLTQPEKNEFSKIQIPFKMRQNVSLK